MGFLCETAQAHSRQLVNGFSCFDRRGGTKLSHTGEAQEDKTEDQLSRGSSQGARTLPTPPCSDPMERTPHSGT